MLQMTIDICLKVYGRKPKYLMYVEQNETILEIGFPSKVFLMSDILKVTHINKLDSVIAVYWKEVKCK